MDVLILCGGLGTRLRPVAKDIPKPMMEVGGRPFLDLLLGYVRQHGFRRCILCAGFQGERIRDHYQKSLPGMDVEVAIESEPRGTAGAVKNAESLIRTDPFLVMNGDSFCNVDLKRLAGFHREKQAAATLALTRVPDARDFGTVLLDPAGAVSQFLEKTGREGAGLVNAGIYVFTRPVLEKIPGAGKCSMEYDVFPSLVGRKLYGYTTDQPLFDIGTPERLELARKHLNLLSPDTGT